MKKSLLSAMILITSISFNAQADGWNDVEAVYLDLQHWFLNIAKPLKTKW